MAVPAPALLERRAIEVGRWEIPVRVDGAPTAVTGVFRFEPPSTEPYTARLTSPSDIADGVTVTLLPGRVPGLLVHNATAQALLVFGADGEPFLRIGPTGVDANLHSTTSRQSARAERDGASFDRDAAPEWRRGATAPRFSWVEPRAAAPVWQVPMQLGAERLSVTGAR